MIELHVHVIGSQGHVFWHSAPGRHADAQPNKVEEKASLPGPLERHPKLLNHGTQRFLDLVTHFGRGEVDLS